MKRIGIIGLCLTAMFAFSTVVAGVAHAAGPDILVNHKVLVGEALLNIEGSNVGPAVLSSTDGNVECASVTQTSAKIIGTDPGVAVGSGILEKCIRQGHNGCHATTGIHPTGLIGPIEGVGLLAYPKGKTGSLLEREEKALGLVMPLRSTNEFVQFTYTNSLAECGLFSNQTVKVIATGTELTTNVHGNEIKSKCGVISQLGGYNLLTNAYELAKSGEEALDGASNFPTAAEGGAITEAEVLVSPGTFGVVKCGLEVTVLKVAAFPLGLGRFNMENMSAGDELGWLAS
jgi:hypothetical protein